jgi:LPS-assembly protein
MLPNNSFKHAVFRKSIALAFCCGTAVGLFNYEAMARQTGSGAWNVTADRMLRLGSPENVVAEGNVVLTPITKNGAPPLKITGDWVRYNVKDNTISARGNLTFHSETEEATAWEAKLNLEDNTATIRDATLFIPESNLHFTGETVEKTGNLTYHLQNSTMTTCTTGNGESPPWSFSAADASLDLEGVVVLKHSTLRIKGIPVFYFPYMIYPANRKRRTGFLLPEFSQSERSGTGVITPFFVNLSPSADLTLYPGYLTDRGMVAGAEFRYVGDSGAKAMLAFSYLHDKLDDTIDDDYKDDGYLRSESHRYWLRGMMDYDFGDDLMGRIDLDMVSDRDYLQEFQKSVVGFKAGNYALENMFDRGLMEMTVPFRESRVQLAKNWDSVFLGGEFVGVDDIQDDDRDESEIQTLPKIFFAGNLNVPATSLNLLWDSQYEYFWREQGVGGHRLDVNPRLVTPLPFGGRWLEGTVTTGFRQTSYFIEDFGSDRLAWDKDDNQNRTAFDAGINLGTTLNRDYAVNWGSIQRFNHSVRPEISYDYMDVGSEDDLPYFDSLDRLSEINKFRYEIRNDFLLGGTAENGSDFNRYIGYFSIDQDYDIHEQRRDLSDDNDKHRPFSDINFTLDLYPLPNLETKYVATYNVYGQGINSYDILNRYTGTNGDTLSLDYRFVKGTDINQLNGSFLFHVSDAWAMEGSVIQNLDTSETVESSLGVVYQPDCWALKLLTSHTPDDNQLMMIFSIIGLGEEIGLGLGTGDGAIHVSSENDSEL